jgi:two-component system sensor kinase FixL
MSGAAGTPTTSTADAIHAINQRIFETSQDLILVVDRAGTFIRVSPSSMTILGYEPAQMVGHSAAEFLYGEDLDPTRNEMRRARRELTIRSFECRYVHKQGRVVSLWWSGVWSGPEDQYFFIGRDITDRKEAELRLRELQGELAHVARLSEMGQMVTTLAHELSQPLTAASNYLEALRVMLEREDTLLLDRARSTVASAIGQIARVGEIIKHLRGYVKKSAPVRKPEDCGALIEEASTLASISRRVLVQSRVAPDLPRIMADKVQIQQVLINILRNAVEAMETSPRREIAIQAARGADGLVAFAVTDTGPGIAQHIAERLFQPFVTTKDHGMGVGLSLCRAIIEAHGGSLWAEPNPEGGSIFRFTVPASGS